MLTCVTRLSKQAGARHNTGFGLGSGLSMWLRSVGVAVSTSTGLLRGLSLLGIG